MYYLDATGKSTLQQGAIRRYTGSETTAQDTNSLSIDQRNVMNQFTVVSAPPVEPVTGVFVDAPTIFHVGWCNGGTLSAHVGLLRR